MPVPYEALIPYGIITLMFGITGAGLGTVKYWQNGWKTPRWALDNWDRADFDTRVMNFRPFPVTNRKFKIQ
ncbi:hypothetical protein CFIMG_006657RA [Ceratocystis fimbriata CBS 114723]|uniref:NADH dehydrogenase [ubiquinone] 1 alpha subcomplex subunit 1 n=1 Tax=Ceratocystis fimbriata CBS 114723 TaxID=1035309 RepID=A0A2C5W8S8_9PEZI|nr:hypothetical protein CFIMG_006657RA [Ceratocystis fimbriata CBS 114723]